MAHEQLPEWFTGNETGSVATSQVVTTPSRPRQPKGRIRLILGVSLSVLVLVGGIVGYLIIAHNARVASFTSFYDKYEVLETSMIDLSDITEPDDLVVLSKPTDIWKAYVDAFNALTMTPLYEERPELIDAIGIKTFTYEAYANRVLPVMLSYLSECYTSGDITMANDTCRTYIQTAQSSGDTLTKDDTASLLTILDQARKDGALTEQQTDSILELLHKIFSSGTTLAETVRPQVIELGASVGVVLSEHQSE